MTAVRVLHVAQTFAQRTTCAIGGSTQAELWHMHSGTPLESLRMVETSSSPTCAGWDPLAPSTLAVGTADGTLTSVNVDAAHEQQVVWVAVSCEALGYTVHRSKGA